MKTTQTFQAWGLRTSCGLRAAVVVAAVVLGVACDPSAMTCTAASSVPPIITVTDARTGAAICDADVVVIEPPDADLGIPPDSSYWQLNAVITLPDGTTIPADGGSTACTYAGAPFDRIGDGPMTIVVSKPGYRTATATAITKGYGCDVPNPPPAPDRVNVMLEPDPVPNDAGSE